MRTETAIMADVHKIVQIYPAGSGHFVYTSGMHGNGYVDYRALGKPEHKELLEEVVILLFRKALSHSGFIASSKIVACGPETMGKHMIEALERANIMGKLPTFKTLYTLKLLKDPKTPNAFIWNMDPEDLLTGAQIIWFDDLLNMGSTAKTSMQMVEQYGNKIGVVATIGDRCNVTANHLGVARIVSLETHPGFTVHNPKCLCTLCEAGVPIVRRPGHGYKFEAEHPDYRGGFIDSPTKQLKTA